MKITTNHQPRQLLYGYELPETQRKEFDYIPDEDFDHHDFFLYKGNYYDPSEFMLPPQPFANDWDGYSADSYFSGVLIKYTTDDRIIVGRYTC